jgi:hypothetical protein
VFRDVSKKRGAFETSGNTNAATQRHIPEDLNQQQNSCLNLVLYSSNICSHIPLSYGIQIFNRIFVSSCQWITSCARLIKSISAMFLRFSYMLSSHVSLDLQSGLFCSGFPIKNSCIFLISPIPVMCRPHRNVPDLIIGTTIPLQAWTNP